MAETEVKTQVMVILDNQGNAKKVNFYHDNPDGLLKAIDKSLENKEKFIAYEAKPIVTNTH